MNALVTVLAIIILISFFISPVLYIIAVNKLWKYKKENAELKSKLERKESSE